MKLFKSAICALFLVCGSANAVVYELPSEDGYDQVQLQSIPDYSTVCDSIDLATCDVEPGTYQLVIYSDGWLTVDRQRIDIVDPGRGPQSGFTIEVAVDVSRPTLGESPGANAECPLGSKVIGVLSCTSIWRDREFPNTNRSQAATGFGSDNANAGCFHIVGADDSYETLELVTTLQIACLPD